MFQWDNSLKSLGVCWISSDLSSLLTNLMAFHKTLLENFCTHSDISTSPGKERRPYSVGIVGVKNIPQLNYDRSISPFNIQDEFKLPNFTLVQVQELFSQYTDEVGQPFDPEVIISIHKQTAGQPVLVNRFSQILTEEMSIPKSEPITMEHFSKAHNKLLRERNTNIDHLITRLCLHLIRIDIL